MELEIRAGSINKGRWFDAILLEEILSFFVL